MEKVSEDIILTMIEKEDPRTFETILSTYKTQVYRTALMILKNEADAEDASQDIFLNIYKSLHKWKGNSALSTWIYRITHNVCIDIIRKRKRNDASPLTTYNDDGEENVLPVIDEQADVEEKVIQKSAYGALYAAIDRLPGKYREVIIFREINNLSYEEISKILSLPQGTVKSRIKRGREALKNLLLENKELFVK